MLSLSFARSRTGIRSVSWPNTGPTHRRRFEIVMSSISASSRLQRSSTWLWHLLLNRFRFNTRWTFVESVSSWLHFSPSSSGGTPYDSSDELAISGIRCRVSDTVSHFDVVLSRIYGHSSASLRVYWLTEQLTRPRHCWTAIVLQFRGWMFDVIAFGCRAAFLLAAVGLLTRV